MLYGTVLGAVIAVVAPLMSPETRGKQFHSDLEVH